MRDSRLKIQGGIPAKGGRAGSLRLVKDPCGHAAIVAI